MTKQHFPGKIRQLQPYEGAFSAHQLHAEDCEVLFASYPAGMEIDEHDHDTENHGIVTKGALFMTVAGIEQEYATGDWYRLEKGEKHSARFEADTSLIEFWFGEKA